MKIFNTLTRQKEEFIPYEKNVVRMYVCGPTVYNLIHIGNARPMIVFDAFRRFLTFNKYEVIFVSNFTDVDDKIINRAKEEGTTSEEIAKKYIEECRKDMSNMNILKSTHNPLATEEIADMVELIKKLIEEDYAYKVEDGTVYYNTKKFKEYGKLSHKNLDELQSGNRELKITGEENKKNYSDFVLWKPKKDGEPYWNSEFCKGRPGWHTECCVMAPKYCGGKLDIHAGGEDLIFPHHENEIAQYEAIHKGETYAKYWMHNAFLNIDGKKMSKSLGNFKTVRDVLSNFDGNVLRLLMLSTQYRIILNFSYELMESCKSSLSRITNCLDNIKFMLSNINIKIVVDEFSNIDELNDYLDDVKNSFEEIENANDREYNKSNFDKILEYKNIFIDKLNDDFNSADAITQIFEIVKTANTCMKISNNKLEPLFLMAVYQLLNCMLNVLGFNINNMNENVSSKDSDFVKTVEKMIEDRTNAKKNKDFQLADSIRNELLEMGVELEDTRQGVKWKRI